MFNQPQSRAILTLMISICLCMLGCENASTPEKPEPSQQQHSSQPTQSNEKRAQQQPTQQKRQFRPVKLGGANHNHTSETGNQNKPQLTNVLKALQPLQVMLGSWQGKTFRSHVVDSAEWVWDFKTDKNQPALVMTTNEKNPLLHSARLTFNTDQQIFQLTIKEEQGKTRVLEGRFIVPVADVPGDNNKPQRTYKLQFTQTQPANSKIEWQVVFNQQENNRYLLEFSRKRGKAKFHKFETIASQRTGTSFASIDPDDYGEKTCIITQGLGTSTVTYKGKSYWVCCSGCKAAFEEDPEPWIAKLKTRLLKNK